MKLSFFRSNKNLLANLTFYYSLIYTFFLAKTLFIGTNYTY